MKKVLILFGKKDWNTPAFADMHSGYTLCYEYLYNLAQEYNIKLYRASYTWYDKQQSLFTHTWTFENEKWIRVDNIKPDLIYDKTAATPEALLFKTTTINKMPIINDVEFTNLVDNKLTTSLLFPQYTKKHYKALTMTDLKNVFKYIKTSKIVLKTSSDSGGKNVFILDKKDVATTKIPFPILAQEFIDSSHGIAKITNSIHDLRLVFIENELIYSYLRIPAKDSFLANLSQGGLMQIVPKNQLPNSINSLVLDVQNTFSTFQNKIYTIDIMFDKNQKPWIIELNSMPGLFFSEDQYTERKEVYTKIIKLFEKAL